MKASGLAAILVAFGCASVGAEASQLKGYIWDVKDRTLVVEGVEVAVSPKTRIRRQGHPGITAGDLRIGWEVEVEGDASSTARFAARKIEVKTKPYEPVKLEGFVEAIRERSLYTDGRDVLWPRDLKREAVRLGMQLKGEGALRDDGFVDLKKYELRPAERDAKEAKFLAQASEEAAALVRQMTVVEQEPLAGYVRRVGRSLVPSYLSPDQFRFLVVKDRDINAFALPDGLIVIHTGLLAVLENEAQLAAVLGHEMAHVTHNHGYRTHRARRKSRWAALGAVVGAVVLDAYTDSSLGGDLTSLGASLSLSAAVNGHSRNLEDDADRIGLRYMVAAGYDPFQALEVWRIFSRHASDRSGAGNWFFGSHSTHRARLSNLTREINSSYRGTIDAARLKTNEKEYKAALEASARPRSRTGSGGQGSTAGVTLSGVRLEAADIVLEGVTLEQYAKAAAALSKAGPHADAEKLLRTLGFQGTAHWRRATDAWVAAMRANFELTVRYAELFQKFAAEGTRR